MNIKGFHVGVSPVTRGKKHSVVAKSAYNSGSKLRDEKAGCVHDYSSKSREKKIQLINDKKQGSEKVIEKNVVFSALILPKEAAGITVDREQFWNDIEAVEKSKHAQLGTEIEVMFPHGLSADDRIKLVETYCQKLADRYNILVDVSIHNPHTHLQTKADKNGKVIEINEVTKDNHHAHILLSSREILPSNDGGYTLSKRKNWSLWATSERLSKGLNGRGDELAFQRRFWAECCNEMLPKNAHISEKSYREQGINKLPKMKLGKSLYKDLLKGERSIISEYNEVIDQLNDYIEKNGLIIDYGDDGRIDEAENIQEFRGVTVNYKRRKPFSSISLNNIRLLPPRSDLEAVKQHHAQSITDFLGKANIIEDDKQAKRTELILSLNEIGEALSQQAKQHEAFKKRYRAVDDLIDKFGLSASFEREKMAELLNETQTKTEIKTLRNVFIEINSFEKDSNLQTTQSVKAIEDQLDQIATIIKQNERPLQRLATVDQMITDRFKGLETTLTSFTKKLDKLEKQLESFEDIKTEKAKLQGDWDSAFSALKTIEVPASQDTYQKFHNFGHFDSARLKQFRQEIRDFRCYKAVRITQNEENRLKALTENMDAFKLGNKDDIKQLSLQITRSQKTYQLRAPFYHKRRELIDSQKQVLEHDHELYTEIKTTKTTQLNQDRIDDWYMKVKLLQQNIAEQNAKKALDAQRALEEAQRQRLRDAKLKAERDQKAKEALENARQSQIEDYQNWFDKLMLTAHNMVAKIGFGSIKTDKDIVLLAEKLVCDAMVLESLKRSSKLSELQKTLKDRDIKRLDEDINNHSKALLKTIEDLPKDTHKIEVIKTLSDRFDKLPDITEKFQSLNQDLEQQVTKTKQYISDQERRYSSPRPF
ncbi:MULTISPECIES: MobA/MobL family protein [Psychrobacter]|uniref:MobA/MobL family protein n=1 Tax=Psychrobacter TaxID=497 RepID=UPI00146B3724|nr:MULTISPECIES: MobA/MobL family protein [Psychrobacter]